MKKGLRNCLVVFVIFSGMLIIPQSVKVKIAGNITSTQETKLTVLTYNSLFADPKYDLEGNFSEFSGIPKNDINIIRLDDANELVTTLEIEKGQLDIVIGIDNVLIHLIENKSDLLELYTPSVLDQIDSNLIQNLDPEKYLIPYDYGIISFWYKNQIINSSTHPELTDLTLDNLLESDILSMLIVENPKYSSPGLGFLLWTIAVYGDPEINLKGIIDGDWRDWWKAARGEILIQKSWDDAWTIFETESEGRPIMISYGTSPAYGFCQWADNSTSAVVTYENEEPNAWLQIEGIGLVKDAPNQENAKQFIDWFLDSELQSELPEHQWMYPANTKANVSECFNQTAIRPDEVNRLNDLISPSLLKKHLTYWQEEWEEAVVQRSIPGFGSPIVIFGLFIITLAITARKKKK
ncbi:MAG: thiamine ABC transporter substrate-binding protein [Promethearchaeota archaeon]